MSSSTIILDKCFLQGTSTANIRELMKTHRLAISDGLFYELLTAKGPAGARCFAKLPPVDNPVDLVSHIGTLMRFEIDMHQPAGKPSHHRVKHQFDFNPGLSTPNFELPPETKEAIDEQSDELQSSVQAFIERAAMMDRLFPDLLLGSQQQRDQARAGAEQLVASADTLREIYSSLLDESKFPPADAIDETWAIFRWLQVQLLFSIDLYVRYQGNIPSLQSPSIFERLEHDVLDAQVLMLGCLEGGFATKETKLKRWWRLLCPQGQLYD